jgi:hypothetical protein
LSLCPACASCRTLVEHLQPLTSYTFRLRSFNVFGSSPYTVQVFTTGPSVWDVAAPVLLRAGPTSVTLQWDPDSEAATKLRHLRDLFDEIDADKSGCVAMGAAACVRACVAAVAGCRVCWQRCRCNDP